MFQKGNLKNLLLIAFIFLISILRSQEPDKPRLELTGKSYGIGANPQSFPVALSSELHPNNMGVFIDFRQSLKLSGHFKIIIGVKPAVESQDLFDIEKPVYSISPYLGFNF